jgi:glycyl-tRNA synthetase
MPEDIKKAAGNAQSAKVDVSEKITELAKRRGFFYISNEIYGGASGFYDYGTTGTLLKRNIENAWRRHFLGLSDNFFEIEAADIAPKDVFVASGHIKNFVDPVVKCDSCSAVYRADHLIGERIGKNVEGMGSEDLTKIMRDNKVSCPKCGGKLSDARILNMMFPIKVGQAETAEMYLRPETAQSVYVNFLKQYNILRNRLPMGLAIVGRAFRNEISPRQALIRQREFTQAELQIFFNPAKVDEHERWDEVKGYVLKLLLVGEGEAKQFSCEKANTELKIPKFYVYHMAKVQQFFLEVIKFPQENFRLRELSKEERAFYNKIHFDVEVYLKSFNEYREMGGVHYRTDHDLSGHQEVSKKSNTIFHEGERFIPHILELSFGVDRIFYGVMDSFYRGDTDRGWEWFAFPPKLAPFAFAVFPLANKQGIPELAEQTYKSLQSDSKGIYDDSGSIGKRYARADEVGVPAVMTFDHQTMEDRTVTIRNRDTGKQIRVAIDALPGLMKKVMEGTAFD